MRPLWILVGLLSHWKRHRMQLATLLIGLISATALWSGVQALNQQARSSYDRAAATFGGANTAMLVGRNSPSFPQHLFIDLRRANWPVSPVVEGRIAIGGRAFRLLGIEPSSAGEHARAAAGAGVTLTIDRRPSSAIQRRRGTAFSAPAAPRPRIPAWRTSGFGSRSRS